jgi:hypothetical protein
MKKRFVIFLLLFSALIIIINSETDFFLNIGKYVPALEEKSPAAVEKISMASQKLSDFTDMIPTPSEMIAIIKNEELPIDPSDVAVNAYITDSPMLSFFPKENASVIIEDGKKLNLFGIISSPERQHLIITFSDSTSANLEQVSVSANNEGKFTKTVTIPQTNENELKVDVYTGSKAYGEFESWIYNYLYLTRTENGWDIKKSPVYENNKALYEKDKSTSEALKNTFSIQANNSTVKDTALKITQNCQTDYERLTAIHDWVCSTVYYDTDNINTSETLPYSAVDVLESKRAVCLGFATLSAALCRSIGIPCNVVSGYALGIGSDTSWSQTTINITEPNHAWNEAYVDGRWVIFDTTWDCGNKIENGTAFSSGKVSHIYFDANIDFFSSNHKIIEYMKWR